MTQPENPERLWAFAWCHKKDCKVGTHLVAGTTQELATEMHVEEEAYPALTTLAPVAAYVREDVAARDRDAAVAHLKDQAGIMSQLGSDITDERDALRRERDALEAKLAPALRAIEYLLHRLQNNAELYWEIGQGSQAFYLLCLAEAAATGKPLKEIEDARRVCFDKTPLYHEELRKQLDHWQEHGSPPESDPDE